MPDGPTIGATNRATIPVPQAASRTCSPGCGRAQSNKIRAQGFKYRRNEMHLMSKPNADY